MARRWPGDMPSPELEHIEWAVYNAMRSEMAAHVGHVQRDYYLGERPGPVISGTIGATASHQPGRDRLEAICRHINLVAETLGEANDG